MHQRMFERAGVERARAALVRPGPGKIPQRPRMRPSSHSKCAPTSTLPQRIEPPSRRPMDMITYPQRGWQRIAVFEIDADAPIVDNLRGNAPDSHHLIIPARVSPPGLRWYEL